MLLCLDSASFTSICMAVGSPTSSSVRAFPSRGNTLIARVIIVVALLGAFALLAFMAIRWFGTVTGLEFSPHTFTQREFYYLELPLVRARISPVYHQDVTGPLEKRVRKDAATFPPATTQASRWDLVTMQRGKRNFTGDALIVCRYFDDEGDTARRWQRWNRLHPELAEKLWPAVVTVCREEHYTFVPNLFATAERLTSDTSRPKPTADEFQQALSAVLAQQYVQLADAQQGLEQHELAVELYTAALAQQADLVAALRGRALSYVALNDGSKASADRARLKQLE
jgi:hypothetical protein